jgi:anti-sigma factor RsiW
MEDTHPDRCDDLLASLDDILDQEQPPEQTGRILAHLESCPACAARYESAYRRLAVLREAAQRIRAPAGLLERILHSLGRRPL